MTTVAVLGSTGSIGTQALDVVTVEPGRFEVVALGAGGANVDLLVEQAKAHRPRWVAVPDEAAAARLAARVPPGTEVVRGPDALAGVSREAEVVLNGVMGFAGLGVTLAALGSGRRLALANKESLIAAGPVVQKVRAAPGAEIIPVDSEHCAVHQCLRARGAGRDRDEVSRIVITASGGPFRGRTRAELEDVTVDDALAHPTWRMGPKITIDSSTLMNKGLEVIEAHELFGIDYDRIEVVVHPQSVVHSMVEFTDGSTVAQLSLPDMRLPIGYALAYPDRLTTPFGRIDWTSLDRLDFEPPDLQAFPCLGLAYEAGRAGGTVPAWLNAANEMAVAAFLAGRISWLAIPDVLKTTLDRHDGGPAETAEDVIEADRKARTVAHDVIEKRL
ncbi:MAG: 1-deoxy-D-xylulose-5-phosphate reductoisomerase [Acidimicrobiales bacterium]